jgi:hypothetical protein
MGTGGLRFQALKMRMRSKVAVLLALAGFLGCIVCSTAWAASMSCCAKTCDPCPILVTKSALPASPEKVDVLHALLPAAFAFVPGVSATIGTPAFERIPADLPTGFRRPMRN